MTVRVVTLDSGHWSQKKFVVEKANIRINTLYPSSDAPVKNNFPSSFFFYRNPLPSFDSYDLMIEIFFRNIPGSQHTFFKIVWL